MVTKIGGEILVNSATQNNKLFPKVADLLGGGFVITWSDASQGVGGAQGDSSGSAIKAQLFAADGTKVGAEFLVNTTTNNGQSEPTVATLSDGRFVVAWVDSSQSADDTSSSAVRAQVFNADGSKSGTEFLVNTATFSYQLGPVITALDSGGFVVTWTDGSFSNGDPSSWAVQAQVFDNLGNKAGTQFLVNTTTQSWQYNQTIAAIGNGQFVVAWTDGSMTGGDTSGSAVRAQIFNADGSKSGVEFLVNSTTVGDQSGPGGNPGTLASAGLTDGRFVVAWGVDGNVTPSESTAIRAQIFNVDGSKSGTEFLVSASTPSFRAEIALTGLPDGRFVVSWTDGTESDGDGTAIRAQVFNADGSKSGGNFLVNTAATGFQIFPEIAALTNGQVVVTWLDGSIDLITAPAVRAQVFAVEPVDPDLDTTPGDTTTQFALDIGQTFAGTINHDDLSGDFIDRDYYRVTLTGGEQYTFSADAALGTTDTLDQVFIRLRDANGNTLGTDTYAEGSAPTFTFDVPGSGIQTYYLAISAGGDGSWWDKTGSYSIGLEHNGVAEAINHTPTAQGHSQTAATGTEIALTDLFTFSDLNGTSDIVSFAVQDRTPGGGYLTFDGQQMASNQVYERSISEISRWKFVVGQSGSDQIGFNAIDQADAFNASVVATVSAQAAPEDPSYLRSAEDLFKEGGGKLTTLAEFAVAAYFKDGTDVLSDLLARGWVFPALASHQNGYYYINENASALVAESPDHNSLVITFTGTDDPADVVLHWSNMGDHYGLYSDLFDALDFDEYQNIYVTGHSLGAAMAQAFKLSYLDDDRVEAVAFANPGYVDAALSMPVDNMISITVQGDAIQEAQDLPGLHLFGDQYEILHQNPISNPLALHDKQLYLEVAKYLDEAARYIDRDRDNGKEDNLALPASIEQLKISAPAGVVVTSDTINFGGVLSVAPGGNWSTAFSQQQAPSSPLLISSNTHSKTTWEVGAAGSDVVIYDFDGNPILQAAEFITELMFFGNVGGLNLVVNALAGTGILQNTVYFYGHDGADELHGAAADRRIVADGGVGNDILVSGSGNDTLTGGLGDDMIDGGAGIDTAQLGILSADATWERSGSGWTVTSTDGTDTLIGIERLQFLDLTVSLITPTTDVTGDGTSDILWLNTSSQFLGFYGMGDSAVAGWGSIGVGAAGWALVGKGDFTGDGTTDLLWQSNTGDVGLYEMNGGAVASWINVNAGTSGWSVVGTGDYNGDSTSDVLWQNDGDFFVGLYEMDSGVATWANIGTAPGWAIIGSGDFTGDGTDDILWMEDSSDFVGFYEMNDSAVSSWGSIGTGATGWSMVGIGDFNGDGTDDILWQNNAGDVGFYQMEAGAVAAWVGINSGTSGWSVAAIGDYNGDGTDDILWQEDSTGFVGMYEMHDGAATWRSVGDTAPGWEIV